MKKTNKILASLLFISFLVGGFFSFFASENPDGLEKVAEEQGFIENAHENTIGLIADYSFPIANEFLSVTLAGLLGIGLILVLTYLIYQCFI